MRSRHPHLVVLGGPNGAGKSTAAPALLKGALGVTEFVNPDVIAQGLSAFGPERVALAAGRIMLTRLRELARQRVDFAFETTLASRRFTPWLADLRRSGFSVHVVFLWLPSADLAVSNAWPTACAWAGMPCPNRPPGGDMLWACGISSRCIGRLRRHGEYMMPPRQVARGWLPEAKGKWYKRSLRRRHGPESDEVMNVKTRRARDVGKLFDDDELIEDALWEGVQEALRRHKEAGQPIVVWRDGKVVRISPEAIKLPRMTRDGRRRRTKA